MSVSQISDNEGLPFRGSVADLLHKQASRLGSQKAFALLETVNAGPKGKSIREREHLSFAELDAQAVKLGQVLLQSANAGDRALLLMPTALEYLTSFFACLVTGIVAVPAYPPGKVRAAPRLTSILHNSKPALILCLDKHREKVKKWLQNSGYDQKVVVLCPDRPEEGAWVFAEPDISGISSAGYESASGFSRERSGSSQEKNISESSLEMSHSLTPQSGNNPEAPQPDSHPLPTPHTLAFLQYTSGSVGEPKGVQVSHQNILHNMEMAARAFGHSSKSCFVGWLPLYHDMGLIGNVLQPFFLGVPSYLMQPLDFTQRPASWLEAISTYGATTSGGPDFAYELCVDRVSEAEKAGLDLSRWAVAFNGAEPVKAATLNRFSAAFASCGFRRKAFYPCYGMAEATLFISGELPGNGPETLEVDQEALGKGEAVPGGSKTVSLVSCGQVWMEQEVLVVEPSSGRILPEKRIGEIWLRGESVAGGYWEQHGLSEEVFEAFPVGPADQLPDGEGGFLRTGDLGFVAEGKLYVTGRLKDLIIIRGMNIYPQDLEAALGGCHEALRPLGTAAFGVEETGGERLWVVQEVRRRFIRTLPDEEIAAAMQEALAAAFQVELAGVVLVKPGGVLKTTSGKIRRRATRESWKAGELPVLAEVRLRRDGKGIALEAAGKTWAVLKDEPVAIQLEAILQSINFCWQQLGFQELPGREAVLVRLGLDSLGAGRLSQGLEKRWGIDLHPVLLLADESVELLAKRVLQELGAGGSGKAPVQEEILIRNTKLPLTPQGIESPGKLRPLPAHQRAVWYFQQLAPSSSVYHLSSALKFAEPLKTGVLKKAVEALMMAFPVLDSRFAMQAGMPVQFQGKGMANSLIIKELVSSEEGPGLQEWAVETVEAPFNVGEKPGLEEQIMETVEAPFDQKHGPELEELIIETVEASIDQKHGPGLEELIIESVKAPFDLEQGPLCRIVLFQGRDQDVLLLVVHHLVADMWSMLLLWQKLILFYNRVDAGELSEVSSLEPDFFQWLQDKKVDTGQLGRGIKVETGQDTRDWKVDTGQMGRGQKVDSDQDTKDKKVDTGQLGRGQNVETGQDTRDWKVDTGQMGRGQNVDSDQDTKDKKVDTGQLGRGQKVETDQLGRGIKVETGQDTRDRKVDSVQLGKEQNVETVQLGRVGKVETSHVGMDRRAEISRAGRDWWMQQWQSAVPETILVSDFPRQGGPAFPGAEYDFHLPVELVRALKARARQAGVSLNTLLLALFGLLLSRYSGEAEVSVGIPVSGRNSAAWSHTVGFLARVLPVRLQMQPEETFLKLLNRLNAYLQKAFLFQDAWLELIEPGQAAKQTFSKQASPEQAFSEQASPEQASPEQAFSGQAFSEQASPEQASPEQAFSGQAFSEQASPEQAFSEQASPEQAFSKQASPEQVFSEKPSPEQASPEKAPSKSEAPKIAVPVIRHLFVFQQLPVLPEAGAAVLNHDQIPFQLEGHQVESVKIRHRELEYELVLNLAETENGIAANLQYNSQVFEARSIRNMMEQWVVMGQHVAQQPDSDLKSIPMMPESLQRQLLGQGTGAEGDGLWDVFDRFVQSAQSWPERLALESDSQNVRYRDLLEQVSKVSAWLRVKGIGPGKRVALMCDPGLSGVAMLLGILGCGAAFIPLGPDQSLERQRFLLQDSGTALLLLGEGVQDVPAFQGEIASLETILEAFREGAEKGVLAEVLEKQVPFKAEMFKEATPVDSRFDPDLPAYILYTSGTTGFPKGVVVSRAALAHYVDFAAAEYMWEDAVSALFTPFYFDLTLTALFAPLVSGRPIVIYREGDAAGRLEKVLKEGKANLLKLTPSHLHLLTALAGSRGTDTLEKIPFPEGEIRLIVGGEQLETSLAASISALFPGKVILYNEYGPTETTVGCSIHVFDPERDQQGAVPIGHAIPGTRLYLLDGDLKPVAPGLEGELYVSGAGLAQGYYRNPAQTAASFLPNPFESGSSMYRTGDTGRWLAPGLLSFRGRSDRQVKLRGHRIELAGVEQSIMSHPGVSGAVVELRADPKVLCAWYTATEDLPVEVLSAYLAGRMPQYAVPAQFIQLDAFPLTNNGKLDRAALPEPVMAPTKQQPLNETALRLREIWAEVFGKPIPGGNADYFALGGDSIKAVQLVARLAEQGILVNAGDILRRPGLRDFANWLDKEKGPGMLGIQDLDSRDSAREAHSAGALPDWPAGWSIGQFPLSPMMAWFADLELSNPGHYNQEVVLRLKKAYSAEFWEVAFTVLLGYQESLRLNLTPDFQALVINPEHEGQPLHIQEWASTSDSSFDLGRDLLWRVRRKRETEGQDCLVVQAHHILVDGFSWQILLRDLIQICALLEKFVNEEPLREEPISGEPVSEVPINREPFREDRVSEEPVREVPINGEPASEEPVSGEPASEEPVNGLKRNPGPGIRNPDRKDTQLVQTVLAALPARKGMLAAWGRVYLWQKARFDAGMAQYGGAGQFYVQQGGGEEAFDFTGHAVKTGLGIGMGDYLPVLRILQDQYRAGFEVLVLTALLEAGYRAGLKGGLEIEYEAHGRDLEGLDLSHTVGWLSRMVLIRFEFEPADSGGAFGWKQRLALVQGKLDRAFSEERSFRADSGREATDSTGGKADVLRLRFNFLGNPFRELDNPYFELLPAEMALDSAHENRLSIAHELNCYFHQDVFRGTWISDSKAFSRDRITDWLSNFETTLSTLSAEILEQGPWDGKPDLSPPQEQPLSSEKAPFNTVHLDQEDLDELFA